MAELMLYGTRRCGESEATFTSNKETATRGGLAFGFIDLSLTDPEGVAAH